MDPHGAEVRDKVTSRCGRKDLEAVDATSGTKEQSGQRDHNDQLLEMTLENVTAEAQPQTKTECTSA